MVRLKTVLDYLAFSVALLGFVPLFVHLGLVPRLVFPLALIAGLLLERKKLAPGGFIPTTISLVLFVVYALQINRDNLVGPAVSLLVILLAVRLVSEKSPRNYLQIHALSLFCLAALSLFSLTPLFLVYFCLMLLLIAVSLVILTYYSATASEEILLPQLKTLVSTALLMPFASIPLMLLFFMILPRTQYPLWHFLNSAGAKVTGFSEKVEPGSASAVEDAKSVAFRARTPKLSPEKLYWRAIVLNSFDGKAWVRREPPGAEYGVAGKGNPVYQTIFPEAGHAGYLPALNIPRKIEGIRAEQGRDSVYVRRGAPAAHERYEATSVPGAEIVAKSDIDGEFYLRLPPDLSPRMVSLGRHIAERSRDDAEKIALLERFFEDAKFTYATSGLPVGEDPLDQFLFEKRRGHCEFFASSFALLLRIAGVPTRLVGGYYGGMYNDLAEYYIVTEDKAHVWVEALVDGRGWITIDPSRWGANFSGNREAGAAGLSRTISLTLDALGYYWNAAVINYDLEGQLRLLSRANTEMRRLSMPANLKGGVWLLIVPPVLIAASLVLRSKRRATPEERLLHQFLAKVRREYHIKTDGGIGLLELAAALGDPAAERFAAVYGGAVYRDRSLTTEEIAFLRRQTKQLRNRRENGLNPLQDRPS